MEFNKTEINLPYRKKLYEASLEQSIDTDFTLPDYYPEIVKVLKCMTEINILSSQCNDSGVSIGGQVVMTLLYFGSDDQPNSFTHTVPFTKTVDVSDVYGGYAIVQPRLNYLNTKAVGPRKLEIHGSMAMVLSVDSVIDNQLISCFEAEGIYCKAAEFSVAEPLNTVSKAVFCEDEIQISQSKPSVGKILRKSAKATVEECKFTGGKVVVKGNLDLCLLYCPADGGHPLTLETQSGFSQIFDCPSECDDINFDAKACVDSLELHPKTSLDGEVRNIPFEARITVSLSPYCITKKKIVTDAFSGRYSIEISKSTVKFDTVADRINENYVCKKTFDFGQDAFNEILDMWCDTSIDFVSFDSTDVLIKGSCPVGILANSNDGEAVFFERQIDYEYRYNLSDEKKEIRCRPDVSVQAVSYSLKTDGTVDVSVELNIRSTIFFEDYIEAVSKINVDENSLIKKDNESALVLYFAENETVWDVARKYCASPETICRLNNVDSIEECCNKTLLVPNNP